MVVGSSAALPAPCGLGVAHQLATHSAPGAPWPAVVGALAMLATATTAAGRLSGARASAASQHQRACGSAHKQRCVNTDSDVGGAAPCRRKITNSTALRYMHVTQDMAACLGLGDDRFRFRKGDHKVDARPGAAATTSTSTMPANHAAVAATAGACPTPVLADQHESRRGRLFQYPLTLRDPEGRDWPVLFEATMSCRQFHRRLTKGWREFCRQAGVATGDVIEFWRKEAWGMNTLAVRVVKRRRLR